MIKRDYRLKDFFKVILKFRVNFKNRRKLTIVFRDTHLGGKSKEKQMIIIKMRISENISGWLLGSCQSFISSHR